MQTPVPKKQKISLSKLIEFIYDEDTFQRPKAAEMLQTEIVFHKNETVNIINSDVFAMLEGESTTYANFDEAILVLNDGAKQRCYIPWSI